VARVTWAPLLRLAALVAAPAALLGAAASVDADSFQPVTLSVQVGSVARLGIPLRVSVRVTADAGALDDRSGPIRARVKLAPGECGGYFESTTGRVLLDRALTPQPAIGEPYSGTATGTGRPVAYGLHTVCVYVTDDQRQFATDTTDYQVDVSRRCTRAAATYDRARRAHNRAAAADRRRARGACGAGVRL
jgi:hypothetical protein